MALIGTRLTRPLLGAAILALTAGALQGCGGNIRQTMGLVGNGPDEFQVVKRKPLSMPSGLGAQNVALPTPQPGAPNLVDPRPMEDAQRALQGDVISASAQPTAGELSIIDAAGATNADDGIRDLVALRKERERILDRMMAGLLGRDGPETDPLDQKSEADRLAREAQQSKNPDLVLETPEDAE